MAMWDVAGLPRHCVCCVRRGVRRSGGVVKGRLRRPYRPLQVIGVLAEVLPIARKSFQFSPSAERAGRLPIPAKTNLAKSDERLHAKMVAILWAALSVSHRWIELQSSYDFVTL